MERILIIGSNGAGKSTFSYVLAEKLQLPLIHIDRIYWRDCWDVTPEEEFRQAVLAEAKKPQWIIEGNNIRSLTDRLARADTVFWFEFPPAVCIWGILKREILYRGKARPDMPEECISKLDMKFLRYAWNFNRKNRKRIRRMLAETAGIKTVRFTNRRQVKQYLRSL